jgi:tRNA(Ile)-lysidine synthase
MDDGGAKTAADFISDVKCALCACGQDPAVYALHGGSFGAAVSGGADSVSLLVSLASIAQEAGIFLHVITVNHNIRPAEETGGDAAYVMKLCADLAGKGYSIDCTLRTLEPGEVESEAEKRGNGTEEAARFLRYRAFESFAAEKNVSCICLAHNRNDQLETLLMRFLQGAGGSSAAGIARVRGIYVRPLLDIPRSRIEAFLEVQHISWRTDNTNSDTRYLRNRIRHVIMPELDRTVPGWQTAVLAGGRKALCDEEAIAGIASQFEWIKDENGVCMNADLLAAQKEAVQSRLLYEAFSLIGCDRRVPYRFVEEACRALKTVSGGNVNGYSSGAAGVAIEISGAVIFVKKAANRATDCGFSAIIERSGTYNLPQGVLAVTDGDAGTVTLSFCESDAAPLRNLKLPLCIRTRGLCDEVETAEGGMKRVADVMADWKMPVSVRDTVPVVQELGTPEQKIVCIWGSVCGGNDWVVKNSREERNDR